MSKSPNLQAFVHPLAAGESLQINAACDFIRLAESTGQVLIRINELPEVPMEAGQGFAVAAGQRINRLSVRNPGGSSITFTLVTGEGRFDDFRFLSSAQLDTREAAPDVLTTGGVVALGNTTVATLAAANTLRREFMFVNTDAAATVYVGGNATPAAAEGIPVGPGQSLTLQTAAAVYARQDSGGPVNVYAAELEWSA